MPFSFDTWGTSGGQSRAGQSFQKFTYKTNDSVTDITAPGYFNANKENLRKDDLIFVHREDTDGNNPVDLILRVTTTPTNGNIVVAISQSDDWTDDGSKLSPLIDGRDVSSGSGSFVASSIDPSKIVHTDADKKLVSIDINNAYNKTFRATPPAADTNSGNAGSANTIPRGDHAHPKTQATESVVGQSARASQSETNATTSQNDTKHITPLKLAGRTATETRAGLAEIATQPETDAESDDTRIVTPAKLAGKKASKAEAEGASNDVKLMTPLKTKQFADAKLAETLVKIENDSGDLNNDIKFYAGRMWNTAKTELADLPAYTKRLDASFSEGDDGGALGQGLSKTASTWYHWLAISKDSDPSIKDYYADTDIAGANVPTGWTVYCWINAVYVDGSSINTQILQIGNIVLYQTAILSSSTIKAYGLTTIHTPPGIRTTAILSIRTDSTGTYIYSISSGDINDNTQEALASTSGVDSNRVLVPTDLSSQIYEGVSFGSINLTQNVRVCGYIPIRE